MARFRHPLKLKNIQKEELESLLKSMTSQKKVAEHYGVSQMTVSRRMRALGINHDGKAKANKETGKRQSQSKTLLHKFSTGEIVPFWKGKQASKEAIEKRIAKIKGRPSWNSGKVKTYKIKCAACGNEFISQKKTRKVCNRECSAQYMKILYSDGRFTGNKNPNFGNDKLKESWKNGLFDERELPRHGRGIGAKYKGVWLRSSWEIEFAESLDKHGLEWDYEPKRFKLSNGKTYVPDFYIKKFGLWVEIKGFWYGNSKEKFDLFVKEYPSEKIIVLSEKPLWHPMLNG